MKGNGKMASRMGRVSGRGSKVKLTWENGSKADPRDMVFLSIKRVTGMKGNSNSF